MPAAEIVSDGIPVRAETTSRQPAIHRAAGPFGRKWESCGLPVRFSETTACSISALLRVPGAPPCRLGAVLSAALDTATVAVNGVVHVEGDRLLTQVRSEVDAANQRLQAIERSKVEQIID